MFSATCETLGADGFFAYLVSGSAAPPLQFNVLHQYITWPWNVFDLYTELLNLEAWAAAQENPPYDVDTDSVSPVAVALGVVHFRQ